MSTNPFLPSTCPNPAAIAAIPSDCSFYTDCLEATYECGSSGYPIGYGLKYCNSFLNNRASFSPAGQNWINGTLTCLKKALVPAVKDSQGITCNDVKTTAFDSHVDCYIDNGFCDLAFDYMHPGQMTEFVKDLMSVYNIRDFASFKAIQQVAIMFGKCI